MPSVSAIVAIRWLCSGFQINPRVLTASDVELQLFLPLNSLMLKNFDNRRLSEILFVV